MHMPLRTAEACRPISHIKYIAIYLGNVKIKDEKFVEKERKREKRGK